jgi:hypothetical protein
MKTRKHHRHKSKKHRKRDRNRKHKRTIRHHMRELIKVANSTPIKIRKVSSKINNALKKGSYSPTINQQLVTLKSIVLFKAKACDNVDDAGNDSFITQPSVNELPLIKPSPLFNVKLGLNPLLV